jgi:CubicO group peptidase (beta-lactamase class C family)
MSRKLNAMRSQITALACGAALCVVVLTASAQSVRPEDVGLSSQRLARIEALVDRHIEAGSFTGAVTLVARDGEIVWLEAQGLMDLEDERRMPRNGIFRIMSMTKPIVGVATLMMMEEGKVRLLDPVSRFIPEWDDMVVGVPDSSPSQPAGSGPGATPAYSTEPARREVTVRDLLTHTSGVVSGPIGNSANRAVAAAPDETLADYIPRLGGVPLEFQPGERWAYSAAAGFDVLSRIVEVCSIRSTWTTRRIYRRSESGGSSRCIRERRTVCSRPKIPRS